jgi:methionine synthase II (cobalamin-independent)
MLTRVLAIAALDADVLSIENSKSDAKLLKVFIDESYPRHIGPGVYDIHSPRVPNEEEFKQRIQEMLEFRKSNCLSALTRTCPNIQQSALSSSGSTLTAA